MAEISEVLGKLWLGVASVWHEFICIKMDFSEVGSHIGRAVEFYRVCTCTKFVAKL